MHIYQEALELNNRQIKPLISGPLSPRGVIAVRVHPIGQIELFNHLCYLKLIMCKQMINIGLNYWY